MPATLLIPLLAIKISFFLARSLVATFERTSHRGPWIFARVLVRKILFHAEDTVAHLCQGCTAVRRCSPCDDSAETPSLRNFWSQPPLETPPSPASRQNTRTDCLLSVEIWSSPSGLPSNRTLLREYDRFLYQYFSRDFPAARVFLITDQSCSIPHLVYPPK